MVGKLVKRFFLAGLLIGIVALNGCSKESSASKGSAGPEQQTKIQQHAGDLFVKILPESPTSSDDLQAVFSSSGSASWRWEKNGQILENEKAPRLTKNRFAKGDTISVIVTAGGKEGKASVTIANSPPEVMAVRLTPDYICRGVEVTAVPNGVDADGDEIRYNCKWIINAEDVSEEAYVLRGDKIKKGDRVSATVTAYDSYGTGKAYKTQAFVVPNAAPVFTSTPPDSFKGGTYTYKAVARDPDGDDITYSLTACPKGMTIDGKSGTITWPIHRNDSGSHTVEVVAQDSEGAKAFQQYSLNITLPSEGYK